MKKQLFTLVVMIALLIGAGSAMGQSAAAPYVGSKFTYTVDGLTKDNVFEFAVTSNTADLSTTGVAITSGGVFTSSNILPATGVVTDDKTASIDIVWNSGSVTNTYRLWIKVKVNAAATCWNYEYMNVTPISNQLDFTVVALGTGATDGNNPDLWATAGANATDCPRFIGEEFLTADADAGYTYAYFRVSRTPDSRNSDWVFKFEETTDNANLQDYADGGWMYSYNGSDFFELTENVDINVPGANDNVLVRLKLTNVATANILAVSIGNTSYEVTNLVPDGTLTNNSSTLNISPIPTIGTFSGI